MYTFLSESNRHLQPGVHAFLQTPDILRKMLYVCSSVHFSEERKVFFRCSRRLSLKKSKSYSLY